MEAPLTTTEVEIVLLLVSPLHRYEGRPSDGPAPSVGDETVDRVEIRAGMGIVGDRYFNRPAHRRSAVSLFAAESLDAVAEDLALQRVPDQALTRRNIVLRGADVDALTRRRFSLDSGDGPIEFQGHRPANPCAWMDVVLAPGAFRALRGRGGIRAEPITDGRLRLGRATLAAEPPAV